MTSKEFRELRHKLGLSRAQLAHIMGMAQRSIWRIEEDDEREPTNVHVAFLRYIERHPPTADETL